MIHIFGKKINGKEKKILEFYKKKILKKMILNQQTFIKTMEKT